MKITYINIYLLLFFLVSCDIQLDNKNYFVCDHIDFDTTHTLIIDTEKKEFLLGSNLINENFKEDEVLIEATQFSGGNNAFKDVFSFDKLQGTLKVSKYGWISGRYEYGFTNTYKCTKTEPLID